MLQSNSVNGEPPHDLLEAQQEDPERLEMVEYLEHGKLRDNDKEARRVVIQFSTYCLVGTM